MSKSLGNVIDPCDLMEGRALPELLARLKAANLDPKQQTLCVAIRPPSSSFSLTILSMMTC
jgi:valyl-tRNA synthetase